MTTGTWTIASRLEDFRRDPETFRNSLTCPYLVELELDDLTGQPPPVGFHTGHYRSGGPTASGVDWSSSAASLFVLPVQKRRGGLFAERIGVGRTRNVDICIAQPSVSKYHAYLMQKGQAWSVTDAGSRNGTWVNYARLEPKTPEVVEDGATIRFGVIDLQFVQPETFLGRIQELASLGQAASR